MWRSRAPYFLEEEDARSVVMEEEAVGLIGRSHRAHSAASVRRDGAGHHRWGVGHQPPSQCREPREYLRWDVLLGHPDLAYHLPYRRPLCHRRLESRCKL